MRVPLEWLHEFTRPALSTAQLADRLDLTGTVVDRIHHHGVAALDFFVVGRVLTADEPPKAAAAQMDWSFTVWQLANWKQLGKLPPALKPADMGDANNGPPTQIDVYTGGHIQWADVVVPKGIEVIDDRLEAHGVSAADGTVLEGTITDLDTKKPLAGRVELQLIDPQKKGGYHYSVIGQTDTDAKGKWRIKNAPAGWVRIVLLADGYVPRIVGFGKYTGEPGWHPFNGALLRRLRSPAASPMPTESRWQMSTSGYTISLATARTIRLPTIFASRQTPMDASSSTRYRPRRPVSY